MRHFEHQNSSVRGGALVIGGGWQMPPATLTRHPTRKAAMKRLIRLFQAHRDLIADITGAICTFATGYLIIVIFAALE